MKTKIDYSMYLVADAGILDEKTLLEKTEIALKSGVSILQLRAKKLEYENFLSLSLKMKSLTDKYQIPLIINDNIQIAKEINADGVHIGQDDESLKIAREVLKNKIIGVSVSNLAQAKKAYKDGADYLGVGSVFFTKTKSDIKLVGLESLKNIAENVNIPKVAIGGIKLENAKEVLKCKVDGLAVITAILLSDDVEYSVKKFMSIIRTER